jgi:hypothetical protein
VSVYIPVELQRKIRAKFADCCAYCHTAEYLTIRNQSEAIATTTKVYRLKYTSMPKQLRLLEKVA